MGEKQKNNGKFSSAFFVALFFVLIYFSISAGKVRAAETCSDDATPAGTCTCFAQNGSPTFTGNTVATGGCRKEACGQVCKEKGAYSYTLSGGIDPGGPTTIGGITDPSSKASDFASCDAGMSFGGAIQCVFKMLIYGIFVLFGWVAGAAAVLFTWVIDSKNISGSAGLLNAAAVKNVWVMVRDTLNMAFIMVLLFAAFCTIFQVEKWNLKKVWLNVLINALLVNFSFAIGRFIIDIANVMMYYFFNNMFQGVGNGGGIFAAFGGASNLADLLIPKANIAGQSWAYLISAVIFMFIFAVTLLVVAFMFVIRLIALTILIMFSPIGFVGYIFPSTSKFADDWWSALFKYAFFGPIMAFMMAVALQMMSAFGQTSFGTGTLNSAAQVNVPANGSVDNIWIAKMAFFSIPIFILWIAMGISQKLGIEGADKVVGKAKGISQGFGKWTAAAPFRATGVSGGVKMGWENFKKKGPLMGSEKIEERSARIGKLLGDKHAVNDVQAKRVKEAGDHHDTANMTEFDLRNLSGSGNQFEKAAALQELANRGQASAKDIMDVRGKFGENSRVFNQLRNKVKTYDPAAAFATQIDPVTGNVLAFDSVRMKEHLNSNQFDAKKLNSKSLANAEFMEMALATGNMKPKEIEELAGKSATHANNIKNSLNIVLNQKETDSSGNVLLDRAGNPIFKYQDMNNESHRNMHTAYLAQNKKMHDSIMGGGPAELAQRAEILKRADSDTLKRIDADFLRAHASIIDEISSNVSPGKIKNILVDMNKESQKQILDHIRGSVYVAGTNSHAVKRTIERDPQLRNII